MSKVTTTIFVHAAQESVSWVLKPLLDQNPTGTQTLDLVDSDGNDVLSIFLEVPQVDQLQAILHRWTRTAPVR